MFKFFCRIMALACLLSMLAGCGETVHGVIRDSRRIGSGVHQIFVREK